MGPDPNTTCDDFQRRLDSFLDGEIDSHSMQRLSLHASHCPACALAVEHGQKLEALLESTVEYEVQRIDTSHLWQAIESRLEAPQSRRSPLGARWRAGWERAFERGWLPLRLPALAASGALAVLLAMSFFGFWPGSGGPGPKAVQVANNRAQIERIESSASHVAVWSEPEQQTTAIWVASFEP